MTNRYVTLLRNTNQALGVGQYALEFLRSGAPSAAVLAKTEQFHLDSVACGVAAIGISANAPRVLRDEALTYKANAGERGATIFGSTQALKPEKAILANSAAVRELDSNGTNFGYNPATGNTRGEFGHNDFYPVCVAAAQETGADGRRTLLAMIALDEIRGRLAEVFALKNYKIDHVLHGAIASAAVYAAMHGASAEQIESAIGLVVAHYVPFRAIRHGHQLSDSKGASAAISTEMAIVSAQRALRGFVGPKDIFRNPQAVFCLFEPPTKKNESPFDLQLALAGDDFAVMGMHFKLGLYEHQSAGAIAGLLQLLTEHPELVRWPSKDVEKSAPNLDGLGRPSYDAIKRINITIYEPAFSIIGDPHKRDPHNRQSADHSMVYIIATLLRKAIEQQQSGWQALMLTPDDYNDAAIFHPLTRSLMQRIDFRHGGADYDAKYPDGIPTTLEIEHEGLGTLSSGLVMYPLGHARHDGNGLRETLAQKFRLLAQLGVEDPAALARRMENLAEKSPAEMRELYAFPLRG